MDQLRLPDCTLQLGDRRRSLMSPGTWTELFFLDEATALAAGHRAISEASRGRNMRQLLLRTLRVVSRDVLVGLHARGYAHFSSAHTTLLSNIDLAGSTVTVAAERAGISKQAMGRLAAELEEAGYIHAVADLSDARARILHLTAEGERLVRDSFEVMAELQAGYARAIGAKAFAAVLEGLTAFVESDPPSEPTGTVAGAAAPRSAAKRRIEG